MNNTCLKMTLPATGYVKVATAVSSCWSRRSMLAQNQRLGTGVLWMTIDLPMIEPGPKRVSVGSITFS